MASADVRDILCLLMTWEFENANGPGIYVSWGCFYPCRPARGASAVESADYSRAGSRWSLCGENRRAVWSGASPKAVSEIAPTSKGFSSFSVCKGKAFTMCRANRGKPVVALDAATGKELWAGLTGPRKFDGGGDSAGGGDGPRSTPTVSDGKVYVFTANLVVHCRQFDTGKPIWTVDLVKQHHGKNIHWDSAASPVVEGDLVFVAWPAGRANRCWA